MTALDQMDATEVMARTLWAEARSEGRAGLEAVASVILNRAKHPRWWGHDVRSVCLAPYQFSCWNSDDPQRPRLLAVQASDATFALCLDVARRAIAGEIVDQTGGADSYFNPAVVSPSWAVKAVHTKDIGRHAFYRVELPAPIPKPLPLPPIPDRLDQIIATQAQEVSETKISTAVIISMLKTLTEKVDQMSATTHASFEDIKTKFATLHDEIHEVATEFDDMKAKIATAAAGVGIPQDQIDALATAIQGDIDGLKTRLTKVADTASPDAPPSPPAPPSPAAP
jgi:N-acetylmuramoyl-L-alanine amidase